MSLLLDGIAAAVTDASALMHRGFTVREKHGPCDLVTDSDTAVENFLRERLSHIVPQADFAGEESADAADCDCFFSVDPIDGTSNYSRGIGLCAVSVALVRDGAPELGVVCNPFTGELFTAERGKGAFLNGKKITVSGRDLRHSVLFTAYSLYRKEYAGICRNVLDRLYPQCADFRRLGSAALELAYIAAGRAELYFEARVYPWDVCAGLLLITEAGGFTETLYTGKIGTVRPFPLIAANSRASLEVLRQTVQNELPAIPDGYFG